MRRGLLGVTKGSVLESILFNIVLYDLFLVMTETEFTSYADDNTLCDAGNTVEDVIHPYINRPKTFQIVS